MEVKGREEDEEASTVQLPAWKPAFGFFGGVASPADLGSEKEAVLVLAGVCSTRDREQHDDDISLSCMVQE